MLTEVTYVDAGADSVLERVALAVRSSGQAAIIRIGDEEVAAIVPVRKRRGKRTPTPADVAAFQAAAGAWRDTVDVESFKRENAAQKLVPSNRHLI